MQFSTLILAAIATMASAGTIRRQTDATCPQIDAIPSCGSQCIFDASTTLCEANDYACMCENFAAIRSAAGACVIGGCGAAGTPAVLAAVQEVCNACVLPV